MRGIKQRWVVTFATFAVLLNLHFLLRGRTGSISDSAFHRSSSSKGRNFAFATLLAPKSPGHPELEDDTTRDGYFESVRLLVYQLLHSPSARSTLKIPVVILVTNEVSQSKVDRLVRDGATVMVVERLISDWITPKGKSRWLDVLTKLRLLTLTQYDKICFIDADHLVTRPMDGIFDDPATAIQRTAENSSVPDVEGATLPDTYIFAARPEVYTFEHPNPPHEYDYLNAGLYVFKPDTTLWDYYQEILSTNHTGLFNTKFPEQNLFNYVYQRKGKMPWHSVSRSNSSSRFSFLEHDKQPAARHIWNIRRISHFLQAPVFMKVC